MEVWISYFKKHSASGEYRVDKEYKILHLDYNQSKGLSPNSSVAYQSLWNLFWNIKLPMKILTFIWTVQHDSIPILAKGVHGLGRVRFVPESNFLGG